jgi:hypothetical protein
MIALAVMPIYGGRANDDNGYPPIAAAGMRLDLNVTVFSGMIVLLLIAIALLAGG